MNRQLEKPMTTLKSIAVTDTPLATDDALFCLLKENLTPLCANKAKQAFVSDILKRLAIAYSNTQLIPDNRDATMEAALTPCHGLAIKRQYPDIANAILDTLNALERPAIVNAQLIRLLADYDLLQHPIVADCHNLFEQHTTADAPLIDGIIKLLAQTNPNTDSKPFHYLLRCIQLLNHGRPFTQREINLLNIHPNTNVLTSQFTLSWDRRIERLDESLTSLKQHIDEQVKQLSGNSMGSRQTIRFMDLNGQYVQLTKRLRPYPALVALLETTIATKALKIALQSRDSTDVLANLDVQSLLDPIKQSLAPKWQKKLAREKGLTKTATQYLDNEFPNIKITPEHTLPVHRNDLFF